MENEGKSYKKSRNRGFHDHGREAELAAGQRQLLPARRALVVGVVEEIRVKAIVAERVQALGRARDDRVLVCIID